MAADPDRQIADIARRQHGAFNRQQATSVGFTAAMIRVRVARGEWLALERDIFAMACFPRTWDQRCMAATLVHPAAATSHSTSATMLGLDGFRPGSIHVTVPPVAAHVSRLATVHRSRHHQFERVGPLRVTTFAQTIVQLAATVSDARLRAGVHSGVHQSMRNLDRLQARVVELRGRHIPGLGRVVDLLEELDGEAPTASELERLLFDVMAEVPGMPPIVRQAEMPWRPGRTSLVDGHVPAWELIVEADGRAWHTRVADFEKDRWRDAEAAAHGLTVMRFTWRRLTDDRDGVIDQLSRFGRLRSARAA